MKLIVLSQKLACVVLLSALVVACGSSDKPEPKTATSQASARPPTPAELWAEKKVAAEIASGFKTQDESKESRAKSAEPKKDESSGDPLAVNSELEEASIPKVELTPKKQIRGSSPKQLNAALKIVKSASSVDEATKRLTSKLGKPSWTESPKNNDNAKRRVWVARSKGPQCHRLVLDADGSVEVESASKTEWRMLAASARQNPCTGEIQRGLAAGK